MQQQWRTRRASFQTTSHSGSAIQQMPDTTLGQHDFQLRRDHIWRCCTPTRGHTEKLSHFVTGRRRGRSISAGIAPEARLRTARRLRARQIPGRRYSVQRRRRLREIGVVTGKDLSPQKGPHPANTGPMDDERYRRDPAGVPNAGRAARNAKQHEVISLAKDPPISVALSNERFSQARETIRDQLPLLG